MAYKALVLKSVITCSLHFLPAIIGADIKKEYELGVCVNFPKESLGGCSRNSRHTRRNRWHVTHIRNFVRIQFTPVNRLYVTYVNSEQNKNTSKTTDVTIHILAVHVCDLGHSRKTARHIYRRRLY